VVKLGGESRKLQFFAMRSMASGDAFHCAYPNATQQALLEGHELAFAYFGGVFHKLRYDNMTSVVKKILAEPQVNPFSEAALPCASLPSRTPAP